MTEAVKRRPITDRQREVYEYIRDFRNVHGYCVSVQEVASHFGWGSKNAVLTHIWPLRRRGWVTWEEGQYRTLRIVEGSDEE